MGEAKRKLARDPRSYDYRQYTLYIPSDGAEAIKRAAKRRSMTEENYIRLAIAELLYKDQEEVKSES